MSATNGETAPAEGFDQGTQLVDQRGIAARAAEMISRRRDVVDADYIVRPVVDLEVAKEIWNRFLEIKRVLLDDPACYDIIEGEREMNRTGATRLATAFGLSVEVVRVDEIDCLDDKRSADHRFIVRIRVSKGARYVDGLASCRLSEIPAMTRPKGKVGDPDYRPPKAVPYSQREHFAMTRASTRATKRAIADIVGGTEAE